MNPGHTAFPAASTTRAASTPPASPTSATRPPSTATSHEKGGLPEPSNTAALRITRSGIGTCYPDHVISSITTSPLPTTSRASLLPQSRSMPDQGNVVRLDDNHVAKPFVPEYLARVYVHDGSLAVGQYERTLTRWGQLQPFDDVVRK